MSKELNCNEHPVTIAFVVHAFAPGGLERCAAWVANRLNPAAFRPIVVSLTDAPVRGWLAPDIPVVELHKGGGNSLRTVAQLARVFSENHVDIVHSHNWPTLIECVMARRWARTRYHVHAEHGTLPNSADTSRWRRNGRAVLMRWGLGQTNFVIAAASSIRERVTTFCRFPRQRIVVVPNGVEIPVAAPENEFRKKIRESLGISPNAIVLGSLGRLAPVKGFDVLIRAFEEAMVASAGDVHLLIVGDGPEWPRISEQVRRSPHRNRLHLAGHQSPACDWLRAMDIFVNSSHSEGMSLALLEAMGMGLPVVVTDVGDHGGLAVGDPPCGLTVPPADSTALAAAMKLLVTDEPLRRRLARNSQAKQERSHSIGSMASAYESVYKSLLEKKLRFAPCPTTSIEC